MFLEDVTFSSNEEFYVEIFSIFGALDKYHHSGIPIAVRIAQLVRLNEHLVNFVPRGMQLLVEKYNGKNLMRIMIEELTDWQAQGDSIDSQVYLFAIFILKFYHLKSCLYLLNGLMGSKIFLAKRGTISLAANFLVLFICDCCDLLYRAISE